MAAKSLEEARAHVASHYIGVAGIHAVGLKVSRNAVRIYASKRSDRLDAVLLEIRAACSPFEVELVSEEGSTIAET